ncbi:hypothetical protein [Natronococcus sp.]|uniref:hypothetical protein n=1 Tax=Natronococcus sp. TaxID=35747 RepID=UPI003A4E4288
MDRGTPTSPWPRWFRLLCYGLIAAIVLGMAYRTLEDATSTRELLQGLGGIAILCLLLACLAVSVGILAALAPDGQWLDREFAVVLGAGTLLALALILSRYVSLPGRVFGVVVSVVGLGIIGLHALEYWGATG